MSSDRRDAGQAVVALPPAAVIETIAGDVAGVRARYAAGHRHGRLQLAAVRSWDPADLALAACEPRAQAVAPETWGFLDVETTGLGTGAGVLVFLVGLAGWDGGDFVVEQYWLRDIGEEPAFLDAVAARLGSFAGVVSFNGKAFDVPLLRTRAALVRRGALAVPLHVDLLHVARRLWRHRVPERRLGRLEADLLGFVRHDDIAGAEVPAIYHECLRRGRWDLLEPVLRHNRDDLLSLCALVPVATAFLAQGRDADAPGDDRLCVARVFERAGHTAAARDLYAGAAASGASPAVQRASLERLARLQKRMGTKEAAREAWMRLAALAPSLAQPYEELAKLAEHRDRDPVRALAWVERGLASAVLDDAQSQAFRHRRARLEHKLRRRPPAGPGHPGVPDAAPDFFLEVWT